MNKPLDITARFRDPEVTADGSPRAHVALTAARTLWFNTGTLCNITCTGCYIESSPKNDSLAYLTLDDVRPYLDEAEALGWPLQEVGFTGGEPFMNPHALAMIEAALSRGHRVLVLTNAMQPMMRPRVQAGLARLIADHGDRLTFRVSLDHWTRAPHDQVRGPSAFAVTLLGLEWLRAQGANLALAGRALWGTPEAETRAGYGALIDRLDLKIDPQDPSRLVIFPEMDVHAEVPEITTQCWGILGKSPESVMCASSRMVVKRRGAAPSVLACTLVTDDPGFELGATLAEADRPVALNHPHCAKFCVLGGAACSV